MGDERSGPNPSTGRGTHGGPKGSGDHSLRGEIMGELFGKESVKLLLSRDTQSHHLYRFNSETPIWINLVKKMVGDMTRDMKGWRIPVVERAGKPMRSMAKAEPFKVKGDFLSSCIYM